MNKVFKVVYNNALSTWVAVSEIAKGHSKSSKSTAKTMIALSLLSFAGSATASSLKPLPPEGVDPLPNTTYHPEEIPNKMFMEEVPVDNWHFPEYKTFREYFDAEIYSNRKADIEAKPGRAKEVFDYYETFEDAHKIPTTHIGDENKSLNDTLTNRDPDKVVYIQPDTTITSSSSSKDLLLVEELYKNSTGGHFTILGKVIAENADRNVLSNNLANGETTVELYGSKALLKGNIFGNGSQFNIRVIDGATLESKATLNAKSNYLRLAASSEYKGDINFSNLLTIQLIENNSFTGNIKNIGNGSLDYESYGSYHKGDIISNGELSNYHSNRLKFLFGSRQIGNITLSGANTNVSWEDDIVEISGNSYVIGDINLGDGNNRITSNIFGYFGTSVLNSAIIGNITGGEADYDGGRQDVIDLLHTDIVGDIDLKGSSNQIDLSSFSSLQGNYTGGDDEDVLSISLWTLVNKNNSGKKFTLGNGKNYLLISNFSEVYGDYIGGYNFDSVGIDNYSVFEGNVELGESTGPAPDTYNPVHNELSINSLSKLKGNVTAGSDLDVIHINNSLLEGSLDVKDGDNMIDITGEYYSHPLTDVNLGLNHDKYFNYSYTLSYEGEEYSSLVKGDILAGSGSDKLTIEVGQVLGNVNLGGGSNFIKIKGGNLSGTNPLNGESFSKFFNSKISGSLTALEDDDYLETQDSEIGGDIDLGDGNNRLYLNNQTITKGNITTGSGSDSISIRGNSQHGEIYTGGEDDTIEISDTPLEIKESVFRKLDGGDGEDSLVITDDSNVLLKEENAISNVESISITNNSKLELKGLADIVPVAGDDDVSDTSVTIDNNSELFINHYDAKSNYQMGYNLLGEGLLKLDLNKHNLILKEGNQADFVGTIELSNGTINLNSKQEEFLNGTSLVLKRGGVLHVPHDDENGQPLYTRDKQAEIGHLTIDGGALHFKHHINNTVNPKGSLLVQNLDVRAKEGDEYADGFIVVDSFNKFNNSNVNGRIKELDKQGLLSQDDGEFLINLVEAKGSVSGDGLKLEVRNDFENAPNAIHTTEIEQDDEVVALANYGLLAQVDAEARNGAPKGINASFGLKEIEVINNKQLELLVDGEDLKSDLSARITGKGGIDINKDSPDNTVLSISNPNNDFTGPTRILKGILLAKSSNVLGDENKHTEKLILLEASKLQLEDKINLYVGSYEGASNSKIKLGNGLLHLVHNGETKESVIHENSLSSDSNGGLILHGGKTDFDGAQDEYSGKTMLLNKAHASINHARSLGSGEVELSEKANLDLNFKEDTSFKNDVIGTGLINKFGSNGASFDPANRQSKFSGTINVFEGSLELGTSKSPLTLNAKEVNVYEKAVLKVAGEIKGDLNNSGTLTLGGDDTPGENFTVNNYTGSDNAVIQLSAVWNQTGEFKSDKLIVRGIATGKTQVKAGPNNTIRGDIKQDKDDIFSEDVIEVGAEHIGEAFYGQALTDGAYKADLVKVGNNYRWRLGAEFNPSTSTFIAGEQASYNNAFDSIGSLRERISSNRQLLKSGGQVWAKLSHGDLNLKSKRGYEYDFNRSQFQFGFDLARRFNPDHSHTESGFTLSYGQNDVTINRGNSKKIGTVDSKIVSLGLFTTGYFASGAYYDLVAQVGRINNKFKTEDKANSSQNGWVGLLSAEFGYKFRLGDSNWSATPQAQLVTQYLKLNDFKHGIYKVNSFSDLNLRGRVGVDIAYGENFYVSANVLGDLKKPENIQIGKDSVKESFSKYWGEFGIGGQINLGKASVLYADVKGIKNLSGNKRSGYKANIGLKYSW